MLIDLEIGNREISRNLGVKLKVLTAKVCSDRQTLAQHQALSPVRTNAAL